MTINKKFAGLLVGTVFLVALIAIVLPVASLHAENKNDDRENKSRENDARQVGSTLEIHIFDEGMVLVRGAKVTAVSGSVISAATVFGSTNLMWTINVTDSTNFVQRSNKQSNLSDISVGDFVSFKGDLVTTASTLTVNAKILKDWSVQKKKISLIGKVVSLATNSFVLTTDERGQLTVNVGTSTVFSKGDATVVTFADVHVGDKVSANGTFDEVAKILMADKVKIYVDKLSEQHIFEGTLKAIATTTPPTSFTLVLNENTDVTVNVPAGISIVGRLYLSVSLADFRVGDRIRIWGLREGNTIDATVVRNTSLPR